MKWQFTVPQGNTSINLNAELVCKSHQMEQISITGKNINITILGNRPLIEAIERPYVIPISWRIIQGEMIDSKLLNQLTKSVEEYLKKNGNTMNINLYKEVRKTA